MPDAGYLTIGKVVKRLQAQYPDLSVSKVRYLEDEGLLNPSRTPGGYRLYSQHDIRRLETILYLQKNRFMPLHVIKDELAKGDVTLTPLVTSTVEAKPDDQGPASEAPAPDHDLGNEFQDSPEVLGKFHPLSRMPELLGVSVSFVRGLSVAGVITMRRLLALSEKYVSVKDLTPKTYAKKDGGSLLANIIFEEATHVVFFVGQNVNAAHQGLDIDITMKLKLVEHLAENLRRMGKEVTVNYD
jgi:DNA-binding transcriptional MerR regulator